MAPAIKTHASGKVITTSIIMHALFYTGIYTTKTERQTEQGRKGQTNGTNLQ